MTPLRPLDALLLCHAHLQTSPRHALQLNDDAIRNLDLCEALGFCPGQPFTAGYRLMFTGYAEYVLLKEAERSQATFLGRALNALRANPRPSNAYSLKSSVDTYSISDAYFRIDYRVYSGQITIFNIQPVDRVQLMRDKLEQAALYHVRKDRSGVWQVSAKVNQVETALAAVNGQSNNLTRATWLMGSHLEYEFGDAPQEYTLFHNPSRGGMSDTWESVQDKFGFTTPLTKTFATTLSAAQQAGNNTRWVVHSQGGLIFAEAVRYLLNDSSSWPLNNLRFNGINHPQKGALLDKHSVAFHGNANNNIRSKPLLKRAGIEVVNVQTHHYDLVPNIIGANTLRPSRIIGSLIYANLVLSGSIGQSPHTTAQSMESWHRQMRRGPGKGRNRLQQAVHDAARSMATGVQWIKNYLP